MEEYKRLVIPYLKNVVTIRITPEEIVKAQEFSEKKAIRKATEAGHKKDGHNIHGRGLTGILGEMAVEKYLGKEFIDWSIGHSKKYDYPDLQPIGFDVGIKTATFGSYPYVKQDTVHPEIICIKREKDRKIYICICGIATPEVLTKYQSTDLIYESARTYKTGFFGFSELLPLNTLFTKETLHGQV
jgi:hypothetical protein